MHQSSAAPVHSRFTASAPGQTVVTAFFDKSDATDANELVITVTNKDVTIATIDKFRLEQKSGDSKQWKS